MGFDHLAQALRDFQVDLLQRGLEQPTTVLARDEAPLRQVIQRRHHEQRIALRMPVHQRGQSLRHPCFGGFGSEIFCDFWFAQGFQRDFATQLMDEQVLLERFHRML